MEEAKEVDDDLDIDFLDDMNDKLDMDPDAIQEEDEDDHMDEEDTESMAVR